MWDIFRARDRPQLLRFLQACLRGEHPGLPPFRHQGQVLWEEDVYHLMHMQARASSRHPLLCLGCAVLGARGCAWVGGQGRQTFWLHAQPSRPTARCSTTPPPPLCRPPLQCFMLTEAHRRVLREQYGVHPWHIEQVGGGWGEGGGAYEGGWVGTAKQRTRCRTAPSSGQSVCRRLL